MNRFDRDLQWRTGVTIIPIPCLSSNSFQLTLESLETAYADAEASNLKVKALLITNPSNPLGLSSPLSLLQDILNFINQKNIHLISDEIYSGSVFSSADFVSVAELVVDRVNSDRIHIVYSLSKDLGLPGFRVGVLYSYNDRVVQAARRMSSFSLVSSQTQKMLSFMLSDEEFTSKYIETNRMRLKERHSCAVKELRDSGIECLKGNAGLFCWVNLGEFLEEKTIDEELKLWRMIMDQVRINISPGSSCHSSEAGWFRICFANMSQRTLEVALRRLREFAEKIRGRRRSLNGGVEDIINS